MKNSLGLGSPRCQLAAVAAVAAASAVVLTLARRERRAARAALADAERLRALFDGASDALTHRATHDPLTGLPNRTLFLDRLAHALARARRSGAKLAVLFMDLDDFKRVNDSRGHHGGDRVLVALAPRLTAALRPGDTIARFGGDEFVVLCEELGSEQDAIQIAHRIVEQCRAPLEIDGEQLTVTVSVGVAIVDDPFSAVPANVLIEADAAMYRAKRRGTGGVEVSTAAASAVSDSVAGAARPRSQS